MPKQKFSGFQNMWRTRKHGALQGGGRVVIADDAINAHRKFSPLDNMGIK
jgi:hypothetical protein